MPPRPFLIIFTVFWTALICVFLALAAYGIVNQLRTLSFAQAPAVIDTVERTEHSGDETVTYGAAIAYHYRVAGRDYQSTRLRYLAGSSSDNWASDILARLRKGAEVPVYYNTANPSEAVLIRGLEGSDLFLVQFLTPFTLAMVGFWVATVKSFLPPRTPPLEVGSDDAGNRPSRWIPMGVAAVTLFLAAFLGVFPVAIFFNGFHPPMAVAEISWIAILALSATAGIAAHLLIRANQHRRMKMAKSVTSYAR